ncbi:hypothetical protein GMDG_08722, partial [Pseudogymnoascus destructans 20631-21]
MSPAERSQAAQKRRADMHWVDLSSLVTRLLSSKDFVGGLHSGFGTFADAPTEMWESEAWLCSIRTTSGATISYEDGSPILCSDFVRYRGERFGQHIDRVFAIGIDRRACAATKDEVLVQIQPVYTRGSLPPTMKDAINGLETPLSRSEKLLYEDSFEYISPKNIVSRVEISMDYIFEGPVALDNAYVFDDKTHIHRILNMARKDIRPAA